MTCAHNSVRSLTRYFERTQFNEVPLTRRLSVHLFVATLGPTLEEKFCTSLMCGRGGVQQPLKKPQSAKGFTLPFCMYYILFAMGIVTTSAFDQNSRHGQHCY